MPETSGNTEVTLGHVTQPLAVRLKDDGRIIIQAGDHAGIVFDKNGNVTIFGLSVNIISEELKLDGTPVEKSGIISSAKKAIGKMVDPNALKRFVRES